MKFWLGITTVSALGVLVAGCSSSEPRGYLSSAPRPELTVPPGEMSTQKLVLMKTVAVGTASKGIGSISIAPEGPGLLLRAEFRGAPAGNHVLTLNENADCSPDDVNGVEVAAASAGERWAPDGLKSPSQPVSVPSDGYVRVEFSAPGYEMRDLRGRSFVLTSGGQRIGCGVSN